MTSALGSTAMKYTATKNPPAFHEAMLGSAIQLSVLGYLWVQHTSAAACLPSPLACLSARGAADPWGRQVALAVCKMRSRAVSQPPEEAIELLVAPQGNPTLLWILDGKTATANGDRRSALPTQCHQ